MPLLADYAITPDVLDVTRWTRRGRDDRDGVRREFHPASRRRKLVVRFTLPPPPPAA